MDTTGNFVSRMSAFIVCFTSLATIQPSNTVAESAEKLPGCWPQEYSVQEDKTSGLLTLSTPYYTVEHDLKKGGAVTGIKYTHGRVANLLVQPIETTVETQSGTVFTDLKNSTVDMRRTKTGKSEAVTIECALVDEQGQDSGIKLRTTYVYRWGYIKIHKDFLLPAKSIRIKKLSVLSALFDPSLSDYGYREGITEQEGASPFSFGAWQWGKIKTGEPLNAAYVPRYLALANPGIEGIEWLVCSDLSQWDLQLTGKRGSGSCIVQYNRNPAGIAVSICPLNMANDSVMSKGIYSFDYYLGMPILEGHANRPWLHGTFNRNRGKWLSEQEIKQLAASGIATVHCHNDGDYYEDGLFWRDGSYPPYPADDMKKFDAVIEACHRYGIRVATYFSNKELHSSTKPFQEHGEQWGRKDIRGRLQHNYFRGASEFGVQMCLKSGWLEFLKFSIDRVLKNHNLDGVYYDWNVALLCSNPLHVGKNGGDVAEDGRPENAADPRAGHWDMDELIELMEWTRERVGPDGLIIVHNTKVPMFVTENFANYVVAMEWGYQKWSQSIPKLEELPLEWQFAGARPRGVIGYGLIAADAPRRTHKLFALEALLTGVTPWPASPEAIELHKIVKPLGDIGQYKFEDWRNRAVTIAGGNCASAVYSRDGQAYVLLGNFDAETQKITCTVNPRSLPYPLSSINSAKILTADKSINLDVGKLTGSGENIAVPGDNAVLIHIK